MIGNGLLVVMRGYQGRHAVYADDRAVDGEGQHQNDDRPQGDTPVNDAEAGGDGDEDRDDGLGVLWIGRWDRHAFLRTGSPWMKHTGSRELEFTWLPIPSQRSGQAR